MKNAVVNGKLMRHGVVVLFVMLTGCTRMVTGADTVDPAALSAAPAEITIDGRVLALETYLWRDFMPLREPGGRSLIAIARVTAKDRQPFPARVQADRMWIIHDKDIWETEFSNEPRPQDVARVHQYERIARGGPKWDPGIRVDVIVRVVAPDGEPYLLQAPKQIIEKTH